MTALAPGTVLPSQMDQRQWARWCREQSIDSTVTAAIAAHVAASDPHPQYDTAAEVAAAIAALSLPTLTYGTYTPTLYSVTNVAASTAYACQYTRVGNVVCVSGRVDIDPTATGDTSLGISLPIASNLVNYWELAGAAHAPGIAGQGAGLLADPTNDRAILEWRTADTTNQAFYFVFQYQVL